jgi:undecaprenyl-diphosphatase
MTILEAILLGIVQGVTEFLPVSSSGHLVLVQGLLGWQEPNLVFDVWLHFSTLLAVIIFFWKDFWQLKKQDFLVLLVGSIPAAVVGLFFKDTIEAWFGLAQVVAIALIFTGLLNLITDRIIKKQKPTETNQEVSLKQGLIVGLFQALAIIPGISRSGSTVFAGTMQGLDRLKAFRFSFLLSLPAVLGASLLQLIKVINQDAISNISPVFLWASLSAFVAGLISLYVFEYVIKKAKLNWFGWYCLLLGASFLVFF